MLLSSLLKYHLFIKYNKDHLIKNLSEANIAFGVLNEIKDHGKKVDSNGRIPTTNTTFATLGYNEAVKGWVTFYSYKPTFGFSLRNEFYSWPLFEQFTLDPQTIL